MTVKYLDQNQIFFFKRKFSAWVIVAKKKITIKEKKSWDVAQLMERLPSTAQTRQGDTCPSGASEVQGHPWVHREFEAILSIMRSCLQKDKNSN